MMSVNVEKSRERTRCNLVENVKSISDNEANWNRQIVIFAARTRGIENQSRSAFIWHLTF